MTNSPGPEEIKIACNILDLPNLGEWEASGCSTESDLFRVGVKEIIEALRTAITAERNRILRILDDLHKRFPNTPPVKEFALTAEQGWHECLKDCRKIIEGGKNE